MKRKVDYNELPQVKEVRAKHEELLAKEKADGTAEQPRSYTKCSKTLSFKEGRELWLRVKVTDSFLFREVVGSYVSDETTLAIPGADLLVIDWDMEHRGTIVVWLQDQLRELNENTVTTNVISLIEKLKKLAEQSKDETDDDFDNGLIQQLNTIAQKMLYQLTRGGDGTSDHLELKVEKVEEKKE